jgi:hypothetical protein
MKQTTISKNKGVLSFWLSVLLASIVITMLSSCGTRKVVIDEVKKDSLSQISTKIVTKEDIKIETKNDITTDEFIITPLDTCKDIVIDGKKYRNVTIKYKKTKDNTIQVQDIKVAKKELKTQDTKVTQNRKVKDITKTPIPQLWLLWLLIPIGLWVFYEFKIR